MDVELPVNRLARNLDLKLLGDGSFSERPAAVGAGIGQRGLVGFVDVLGRGRRPMGLGPIVVTRLAARLFRFALAFALGERGRLAFAGPLRFFEELAEPLVFGS